MADMTPGSSTYLNAARVAAALAVLFFHWTIIYGDHQWFRAMKIGPDAVILFFVLSGFVIAYAADTKDTTLRHYAFNRATRLYSVLVPSILLTLLVGAFLSYPNSPAEVLLALTFTAHIWDAWQQPDPNGPMWSVTFEAWYYVIFGALFYLRGWYRLAAAAAAGVVAGPNVLILAPCWWLGVAVYHLRRLRLSNTTAWVAAIAPLAIYSVWQATGTLDAIQNITRAPFSGFLVHNSVHFLRDWCVAVLVAVHFFGGFRIAAEI